MSLFFKRLKKHLSLKRLLIYGLVALAAFILVAGVFIITTLNNLPSLQLLQNRQVTESTKIYDRTGTKLLYELYNEERRTIISFDQIPTYVKQATVAIEDSEFYNHSAVDIKSLLRALLSNLMNRRIVQGGSTITQQLAKNAFLTDDQTFTRKFKELIIAYRLEQIYTKDQILALYLNQIPYGSNAYGIEAAAQTFFQKSAVDLTLAQAALLASLPQAPSYFSPYGTNVKDLLARKELVLSRMETLHYITPQEHTAASAEKLTFGQVQNLNQAPHFVLAVKQYLDDTYGENFVRSAGLRVTTTLDTTLQAAAEKAVSAGAARNQELYNGSNAALVAQDAKTGQVLAMVGSRNFFDKQIDGQFNVATQGLRQPGSALKPFVYLDALKLGYPPQTALYDVQTDFNQTGDPTKAYIPNDYDQHFRGPVTFRQALAESINVPAVETLYLTGLDNLLKTLQSFGITTLTEKDRFGLSLILGGGEVHLNELVGAYSVLAQEGIKHEQKLILKIEDHDHKVLEEYKDDAQPVIDPQYPRMINDILSDASARAPLFVSSLNLTVYPGYDVALKTGTSNDYRDAWAIGYTPSFVTGVWAGNNDNTPMQRKGGSILAAVPILNAFLLQALPTQTPEAFPAPDPVVVDKPMLNGQAITTYSDGNKTYPQLHSILYYVSKSDPTGPIPAHPELDSQFLSWESSTLSWARQNVPGFTSGQFNQTPPPGATIIQAVATGQNGVTILAPADGSYITTTSFEINAHIESSAPLVKVDVFFNDGLIDSKMNIPSRYDYRGVFAPAVFNPQNTLRIEATDINGLVTSKQVIVYR